MTMPPTFHFKQIFIKGKMLRYMVYGFVPALLFYVTSLTVLSYLGFGFIEILRDPAQQTGKSSFLGFLSNMGVWLWVSSAAICFFSASNCQPRGHDKAGELLYLMAMLSMLLAIDDFFMIHDRYVNQDLCYLLYAAFVLTLLVRHFAYIMKIDGLAFLFSGMLLALSILTDLTQEHIPLRYSHTQVFEEGFKFIGAASWLYFAFMASKHVLYARENA